MKNNNCKGGLQIETWVNINFFADVFQGFIPSFRLSLTISKNFSGSSFTCNCKFHLASFRTTIFKITFFSEHLQWLLLSYKEQFSVSSSGHNNSIFCLNVIWFTVSAKILLSKSSIHNSGTSQLNCVAINSIDWLL